MSRIIAYLTIFQITTSDIYKVHPGQNIRNDIQMY